MTKLAMCLSVVSQDRPATTYPIELAMCWDVTAAPSLVVSAPAAIYVPQAQDSLALFAALLPCQTPVKRLSCLMQANIIDCRV